MSYQTLLNDYDLGMHMGIYDVGKYFPIMFEVTCGTQTEFRDIVKQLRVSSKYSFCCSSSTRITSAVFDGHNFKWAINGLIGVFDEDALLIKLTHDVNIITTWNENTKFDLMVKNDNSQCW